MIENRWTNPFTNSGELPFCGLVAIDGLLFVSVGGSEPPNSG